MKDPHTTMVMVIVGGEDVRGSTTSSKRQRYAVHSFARMYIRSCVMYVPLQVGHVLF